jgi:hypothetical protein
MSGQLHILTSLPLKKESHNLSDNRLDVLKTVLTVKPQSEETTILKACKLMVSQTSHIYSVHISASKSMVNVYK